MLMFAWIFRTFCRKWRF